MNDFATLYSWVKGLPIVDWHNHLDMKMLAEDKPLGSLYEVWVKADPYKHRAMRICGEPERLITGDAPEEEKWAAWTRTLPKLVGNPLFAWAKMEMRWLQDGKCLTQRRRDAEDCCAWLRELENVSLADWTPSKMLAKFGVEYISPCVGAAPNLNLCDSASLREIRISPSLRMNAGDEISVETLEKFDAAGCRIVDVSVDDVSKLSTLNSQLSTVAAFAATNGWTMLLHLGALRETSARLRAAAGPAGGFAGMRAPVDPAAVAAFLNALETMPNCFSHIRLRQGYGGREEHDEHKDSALSASHPSSDRLRGSLCSGDTREINTSLPRTILMSLNPEAHAQLAVLAGSFNGEGMPGKVQLGPAWWWCDHEEGMRDVLEKNAAYGVLSTFVGMTTDSRSLLSFVRHDYFRRVLCKWVAEKVASGAFPDDEALLRPLLENICYKNAHDMVFSHNHLRQGYGGQEERKDRKETLFVNGNCHNCSQITNANITSATSAVSA